MDKTREYKKMGRAVFVSNKRTEYLKAKLEYRLARDAYKKALITVNERNLKEGIES